MRHASHVSTIERERVSQWMSRNLLTSTITSVSAVSTAEVTNVYPTKSTGGDGTGNPAIRIMTLAPQAHLEDVEYDLIVHDADEKPNRETRKVAGDTR